MIDVAPCKIFITRRTRNVVCTASLTGPALRGWWVDGSTGETVDAGSAPQGSAVTLDPPDTGSTGARD